MIVEAIVNVIALLILGVLKLFPKFPEIDLSFLDGLIRVLSLADMFVSVRVVSLCFVVFFTCMNLRTIWSIIMWVVRKLPIVK